MIPDTSTRFYHGTTAPDIQRFELGREGFGELAHFIHGIWLSTLIEGAMSHAVFGCAHRNAEPYVYECKLKPDTVIVNVRDAELPEPLFRRLLSCSHMPERIRRRYRLPAFLKRFCGPDLPWFRLAQLAGAKVNVLGEYNREQNGAIAICREIGVDVLLNPSVRWENNQFLYGDESMHGYVALLLNCDKAEIIAKQMV